MANMEAIREVKKIIDHKIVVDLPKSFKGKEVEVIILPLNHSKPAINETMLLSEAVLRKDWDLAEEDKAWKLL
jgi:hypothetical protein